MALPNHGRGATHGFGEESTYGTAEARSNWVRTTTSDLSRNIVRNYRPGLVGVATVANRRRTISGVTEAGGPAEYVFAYEGCGILLKHGLGAVATTGTGPYVHTFTLAAALPTGLTVEDIQSGDSGNIAQVAVGGKINRLTIRFPGPSDVATLGVDWLAEDIGAFTTAGSPSYGAGDNEFIGHQLGQLGWNSNTYDLISLEMVVDNKLTRRHKLGSKLTKEPTRSDFVEVIWRAEVEWEDNNLITDYRAEVQGDVTATATGTGNQACAFTLHNAQLWSLSKPINTAGIIRQRLEFRGLSDGTDEGFKVALTNDDSSAIAN